MYDASGVRRVLIVDDERVISETLTVILSKHGYATKAACSGEEAVDLARVFEPDLLISDVVMSGMTGIEAAYEILSFLPSCKVILFSGLATISKLLPNCHRQTHNFEILAKPVSPDTLLDRISKSLDLLRTHRSDHESGHTQVPIRETA
jgi:DNA-binding NtrC family response regulator